MFDSPIVDEPLCQLRSFQRGVGNYIAYLDARQNLASAEINLAAAERIALPVPDDLIQQADHVLREDQLGR